MGGAKWVERAQCVELNGRSSVGEAKWVELS